MAKKAGNNQRRKQAIMRIVLMALILLCLNVLASYYHKGIDLTKEKRFTLTDATKRLLKNMQETAVIEVYLKGKSLPADMQKMQEAVRERLSAFKDIAGNKIIYRFIDPLEGKAENEEKQVVHDLQQKGIQYLQLKTNTEEGYTMKVCFPYALLLYNGNEMPISLLENPPGKTTSEQATYAEALLEYKIAGAINTLGKASKPMVGYLIGHNEDIGVNTFHMLGALAAYYRLDSINLKHLGQKHISNAYDAIIINQPSTPFSGPEKLMIDQYIMRGGHVLWALKTMNASMDSFANGRQAFLSQELGLDLDDLLYHYGVRVNNDIVEDRQCLQIPQVINGSATFFDWIYFPRINPTADHPIVRNMNFIMGSFTSSMDTILTEGIKKTILLQTSKYSRTAGSPARISLSMASYPLQDNMFHNPYRPVAVLMEGKFHSAYDHRLAVDYLVHLDSLNERFKPICDTTTSMIVTSIGDVFENGYSAKENAPTPLGYYKYAPNDFYANMNFMLNCVEYLTDHSGILEARNKDVKPRLLDLARVKDEKTMWEWVNVAIPIALVLVFASAYMFFRKRRYEVKGTAKVKAQ